MFDALLNGYSAISLLRECPPLRSLV